MYIIARHLHDSSMWTYMLSLETHFATAPNSLRSEFGEIGPRCVTVWQCRSNALCLAERSLPSWPTPEVFFELLPSVRAVCMLCLAIQWILTSFEILHTSIHGHGHGHTHDERCIAQLQARIQKKQIYFIRSYLHHPPPTSLVNIQRCTRAQCTARCQGRRW